MDIGVFIPIANNGWLISTTSPQYMPSFELNKQIVQKAEGYGLDFALSMIKLRGFGGESKFWDYALESFTLMAGLASVTSKIKLFASTAVLTIPPAIAARMAITIDSIAPGRFGINMVSGWAQGEYSQMGLWPGEDHYARRYKYSTEYVRIMQELWETGRSDLKGDFFQMDDCHLLPKPSAKIEIVTAGQSDTGMEFAAKYCDYNFVLGSGVNTPTAFAPTCARLIKQAEITGRDVGSYILTMIIADETDEAAFAKWNKYQAGADKGALSWMFSEATADVNATEGSTASAMIVPDGAVNFNMGTLVGSYANVARMLDEMATVPGTKGIMLTFDDFIVGMDEFGHRIQPLMTCRSDRFSSVPHQAAAE